MYFYRAGFPNSLFSPHLRNRGYYFQIQRLLPLALRSPLGLQPPFLHSSCKGETVGNDEDTGSERGWVSGAAPSVGVSCPVWSLSGETNT